MTVDREQIREYAVTISEDRPRPRYPESWNANRSEGKTLAGYCLALLAELDRLAGAKQELAEAQAVLRFYAQTVKDLEARLAKVPALVEALKAIAYGDAHGDTVYEDWFAALNVVEDVAKQALAVWESA